MNEQLTTATLATPLPEAARTRLAGIGRLSLVLGGIGLAASAVGWTVAPSRFFQAYLIAYLFVLGIVLGSLALVMVQHLSGGAWGLVIRRVLESATRTLPLMALLFVPLVFGLASLYPWARAAEVAGDPLLQHKQPYLNIPFFLGRAVFYFAAWIGVASLLNRWSIEQDRRPPGPDDRRFRMVSAPGLLLYGLTVTFAAVDWIMSLTPEWFSTIFGVLVMGGQGLSALAFVIAVLFLLTAYEPLRTVVTPGHFHDLGKLLLAFVMLWAYFSFSQFLIIWSANLPEEIPWYLRRMSGGWAAVSLFVLLGHFVLPFALLLSRDLKRRSSLLVRVALVVLVMRVVDLFWTIAPAFPDGSLAGLGLDVAALVGIGGLWLWSFCGHLGRYPLLPFNDPHAGGLLEGGHAH